MILFGVILGSFGFISDSKDIDTIKIFANIGIFILIFFAGLETDIHSLKKLNKNSIFISIGGVVLPFLLGYFVTYGFTKNFNLSFILGLIFSSTSASVAIMTLYKLGRLKTVEGNTITNAAIVDDVIGILILSIIAGITSLKFFTIGDIIIISGLNVVIFVSVFLISILLLPYLLKFLSFIKIEFVYFGIGILFLFVFLFFVGEINSFTIMGSYFAGIFLSKSEFKSKIEETISVLQIIFVSIFFVFIGMQLNLTNFTHLFLPYVLTLTIIAFISKILGSGIMARIVGFDIKRSLRIGVGMAPRGEIALIIASITYYYKNISLIRSEEFIAIILMVIITIFVSKYLLKLLFFEKKLNKD